MAENLAPPLLDGRTYKEILAEAKRRIPGYTPEWTDFNASDPGVTLLELFAWLSETFLWELNKTPEKAFESFLSLINYPVRPAHPASVPLVFQASSDAKMAFVPKGASFSANVAGAPEPVVFEVREGLSLVSPAIKDMRNDDGVFPGKIPVKAQDDTPESFLPFGEYARQGSAFYVGFGKEGISAQAIAGDLFPESMTIFVQVVGGETSQGEGHSVELAWEVLTGENIWAPLKIEVDQTEQFTKSGILKLAGLKNARAISLYEESEAPLFWMRCTVNFGHFSAGQAPVLDRFLVNAVMADNLATVRGEVLGTSSGQPFQKYHLFHTPVNEKSLTLEVEDPDTHIFKVWRQVDDLYSAYRGEQVFSLDLASGEVCFGDEINGSIPRVGSRIIARTYRFGGGKQGNVAVGSVANILSALKGVDAVTNPVPAIGGTDAPTLAEQKKDAPGFLRHRNRAVTAGDFRDLTIETGQVIDAAVLSNRHPDDLSLRMAGAVTVVILQRQMIGTTSTPGAILHFNNRMAAVVTSALDKARLIGTELFVREPYYYEARIEVVLTIEPGRSFSALKAEVNKALNSFILPALPENSEDMPTAAEKSLFGRTFYLSNLTRIIEGVPGVSSAQELKLYVNGQLFDDHTNPVDVVDWGLLWPSKSHVITATPALQEGAR